MNYLPRGLVVLLRGASVIALSLALTLAVAGAASACPTCAQGMGNDEAGQRLVGGYFWSILFMMSMPFLLIGGFGAYMVREVRRARAAGDDNRQGTPVAPQNRSSTSKQQRPVA